MCMNTFNGFLLVIHVCRWTFCMPWNMLPFASSLKPILVYIIYCGGSLFIIIHQPFASSSVNPYQAKNSPPPALVEHPTSSWMPVEPPVWAMPRHAPGWTTPLHHEARGRRAAAFVALGRSRGTSCWWPPGGQRLGDGPEWICGYGYGYGYGLG